MFRLLLIFHDIYNAVSCVCIYNKSLICKLSSWLEFCWEFDRLLWRSLTTRGWCITWWAFASGTGSRGTAGPDGSDESGTRAGWWSRWVGSPRVTGHQVGPNHPINLITMPVLGSKALRELGWGTMSCCSAPSAPGSQAVAGQSGLVGGNQRQQWDCHHAFSVPGSWWNH